MTLTLRGMKLRIVVTVERMSGSLANFRVDVSDRPKRRRTCLCGSRARTADSRDRKGSRRAELAKVTEEGYCSALEVSIARCAALSAESEVKDACGHV